MQETFDFDLYRTRVRQVSFELVGAAASVAALCGGMHLLTVAAEKDLRRFGDAADNSRVVCGPGCSRCCVLNVSVLLPEAIMIAFHLRKNLPGQALDQLRQRLQELRVRTRWLSDEERIFVNENCAFLDPDDCCMIHLIRPLLCRSITSIDASACRDVIAMAPMDDHTSVVMNMFQKQLFEAVYGELANALEDACLDASPARLTSAILTLLEEPGLMVSYLAGARVMVN